MKWNLPHGWRLTIQRECRYSFFTKNISLWIISKKNSPVVEDHTNPFELTKIGKLLNNIWSAVERRRDALDAPQQMILSFPFFFLFPFKKKVSLPLFLQVSHPLCPDMWPLVRGEKPPPVCTLLERKWRPCDDWRSNRRFRPLYSTLPPSSVKVKFLLSSIR